MEQAPTTSASPGQQVTKLAEERDALRWAIIGFVEAYTGEAGNCTRDCCYDVDRMVKQLAEVLNDETT